MSNKIHTFVFIFLTIMCISIVAGATIDEGFEKLDSAKDQAERFKDAASYNESKSTFLVNQWSKTLEGTILGNILKGIDSFLTVLSPVFKIFLGQGYTLSWAFFIALFMWGLIFMIIYRPLKATVPLQQWVPLVIAIATTTLISYTGVIEKSIFFFTTLITNIWVLGIAVFVTLIIAMIYSRLMKRFGKQLEEKRREEKEMQREEKDQMIDVIKDTKIKARKL